MKTDILPFNLTLPLFLALVLVLAASAWISNFLQKVYRAKDWRQYWRGTADRMTTILKSYKRPRLVRSGTLSFCVGLSCPSTSNGLEAAWDINASTSESNERHAQACSVDGARPASFQSEGFDHARSCGLHPFTPKSRVSTTGKEYRGSVEIVPSTIHVWEGSVTTSEKESTSSSIVHAPSAIEMEESVGNSLAIRAIAEPNMWQTESLLVLPSALQ